MVENTNTFPTNMDNIFETNSSFPVKQGTTEKIQFLFFQEFLASIQNNFILEGMLSNRLQFYEVLRF